VKFVFTTAMTHYPWAGSEELWGQAALRLAQAGHEVQALVPRYDPLAPRLRELLSAGAMLQLMAPTRARWPVRLWQKLERKWRTRMDSDLAWIKSQRPDLVCISNGNYFDGLFYMEFCAAHGIPFVSIAQANAEWIWPNDATADRIRATYDRARAAFFVAQGNLRLAETQLGAALPRAEVVRNPFNVSWNTSPQWPGSGESTRLACVARYEPSAKGQDLLFEVLAMEKWRSRPVLVSLFGAGPMEDTLKRLVKMFGLQGKVEFCGHVNDVESIWREHHALVLPSRYEGLPLAIVEAMLCGRPCIVTDLAGNAELLEDNVTGFVAEAPTVKCFDEALERAWRARADWHEIGRRASESVRRAVPADPAAVFAQKLVELAK
jgi:glycosyltransferase involved in cell wall biosynthesis